MSLNIDQKKAIVSEVGKSVKSVGKPVESVGKSVKV